MLDFGLATHREVCREFGRRLKARRLTLLLTQDELAARAGVSAGTVRTLEMSGRSSTDSLVRVALALGLADQLQSLFEFPVRSIEQMAQVERVQRVRAPRRMRP